jgi:hypothetical protein
MKTAIFSGLTLISFALNPDYFLPWTLGLTGFLFVVFVIGDFVGFLDKYNFIAWSWRKGDDY